MVLVLVTIQNISVCTTSFTNIQNISSKINIDQEVHSPICLFKDFQCSIQQCQGSKRYCGTCIYICHFSEQAIGFLRHKTSIPLLLDLLPQKSLSTSNPPFYYQVKKCVKHSLSIKSDP